MPDSKFISDLLTRRWQPHSHSVGPEVQRLARQLTMCKQVLPTERERNPEPLKTYHTIHAFAPLFWVCLVSHLRWACQEQRSFFRGSPSSLTHHSTPSSSDNYISKRSRYYLGFISTFSSISPGTVEEKKEARSRLIPSIFLFIFINVLTTSLEEKQKCSQELGTCAASAILSRRRVQGHLVHP